MASSEQTRLDVFRSTLGLNQEYCQDVQPSAAMEEYLNQLQPGDVVLFNGDCPGKRTLEGVAVCLVAKLMTNSKWNHVGMVVPGPDGKTPYLLEVKPDGARYEPVQQRISSARCNQVAVRKVRFAAATWLTRPIPAGPTTDGPGAASDNRHRAS